MHTRYVQSHTEGEQIDVYEEEFWGMLAEGSSPSLGFLVKQSPSLSEGASGLRPNSTLLDSQPDHFPAQGDQAVGTALAMPWELKLLPK